jgi:hypothetical protein
MLIARRVVPAVVLVLCASTAGAQLTSDTVPTQRTVPLREAVETQIEESRWQFGPFRVEPSLKLDNLGYNDNVFGVSEDKEKVDDYTATVGLGIRSIAPLGGKTYLKIDAIPEYTWYKNLDYRRDFGYEVGGGLLALFNRMSIEASGKSIDTVAPANSEDRTSIPQTIDSLLLSVDVEVMRRVFLFGALEAENTEYQPPAEENLSTNYLLLNRDETAQRVGLRYEFRPRFHVQLMYETTDSDFPDDPVFTKNKGEAILAGFTYDRDTIFVNAVGGNRTIDYPGSGLQQFDEFTGSLFASWRFARRTELQLRVLQRPQYSTYVENPYFLESREGARVVVPMGQRFVFYGGAETGKNEYQAPVIVDGAPIERVDDVSNWEAGIGFRVLRSAVLTFSTKVEDYNSNISSFDRKVVTTGINLNLGETLY